MRSNRTGRTKKIPRNQAIPGDFPFAHIDHFGHIFAVTTPAKLSIQLSGSGTGQGQHLRRILQEIIRAAHHLLIGKQIFYSNEPPLTLAEKEKEPQYIVVLVFAGHSIFYC